MVNLYVAGERTQQSLPVPDPGVAPTVRLFAWLASSEESEGQRLTREILSDPDALSEIAAARAEITRGESVRGVAAVRALRPRR
jgi:hypothetical protein